MIPDLANLNAKAASATLSFATTNPFTTLPLKAESEAEVLDFLKGTSVHNVVMSGFIRDNGIESELHRGCFYGCRSDAGSLEGVALIGHGMFIQARSNAAIREFARVAQALRNANMIMADPKTIEEFWKFYSLGGQPPRRLCREISFSLNQSRANLEPVPTLRAATSKDLPQVLPVHAAMAYEESGIDPSQADPGGFRMRCLRRIERGRVWVWIERGELIFKADIIADTPDAIYLEGIYVCPEARRKGYGSRCVSELFRRLLQRTKSISVLVNKERPEAQRFFETMGFMASGFYDTIYLQT
ncbi:MAG TPA: GNAT family N-acetyltransferase [Pyrinomonadaceae bacterium]|nr:GNAT family N-acetyltransferase [Pyrinomonadaceae bacterium]